MKTFIYSFIGFYAIMLFSGCAAKLTEPDIDFKPPKYVEEMPQKEVTNDYNNVGSIFGKGENPLFSDHKAMRVNDIVTIVINEDIKSKTSGSKQLQKQDSTSLGGGIFGTAGAANTAVNSYINRINGLTDVSFTSTTNNTFKGQGSATKDASFTTTVTARVVKVLANGNIFVSGSREILIDDQKQVIQVSGVIRPYDIDQYNRVNSNQMSDAKILYKTEGDVDRATQQGWGTKLIQVVWPF